MKTLFLILTLILSYTTFSQVEKLTFNQLEICNWDDVSEEWEDCEYYNLETKIIINESKKTITIKSVDRNIVLEYYKTYITEENYFAFVILSNYGMEMYVMPNMAVQLITKDEKGNIMSGLYRK